MLESIMLDLLLHTRPSSCYSLLNKWKSVTSACYISYTPKLRIQLPSRLCKAFRQIFIRQCDILVKDMCNCYIYIYIYILRDWEFTWKSAHRMSYLHISYFNMSRMSSYPVNVNSCTKSYDSHAVPPLELVYKLSCGMLQHDHMEITRV